MEATINVPIEEIAQALRGLVSLSKREIKRFHLPNLYDSRIFYKPEKNTENWLTAKQLHDKGYGDCEDLAIYRSAELQLQGKNAWPIIVRTGKNILHAVVQNLDTGVIEDPTRIIKAKMKRKKRKRKMNIKWEIKRLPNGMYKGVIHVPMYKGKLQVSGLGFSPAEAMKFASAHGLNAIQAPMKMMKQFMPMMNSFMPMMQAFNPGMNALFSMMNSPALAKAAKGGSGLAALVQQLPMTIPGAPPEAQAGLIGMKILATIASNKKVKKAFKKIKKKAKKWLHKLHLWGYANALGLYDEPVF